MSTTKKDLRWGYSTGACAAAIATASWLCRVKKTQDAHIPLLFLDGQECTLPLLPAGTAQGHIAIRKDGGDDPDCTHKAILYGSLEPLSCTIDKATQAEDYTLHLADYTDASQTNTATVIIRAVEGIGLCTRLGLDCEQGKWAINTGPRAMIAQNLMRAGMHEGLWLLRLGVQDGEKLARHTLNKQLGIVGGISILGTTGHVRPYSHDAYIATVRICVQSNTQSGGKHMVFCTGGRTMRGAKALFPDLGETAFVCIGDFIAESLASAEKHAMDEVTVACMAGKLCKYAAGFEYTHAHTVAQDMELLRAEIAHQLEQAHVSNTASSSSQGIVLPENFYSAPTVREALLHLPQGLREPVLQGLAKQALAIFAKRCSARLRLAVFDFDGTLLFTSTRERHA